MLKGLYQNLLKNRICPNRLIFLQSAEVVQIGDTLTDTAVLRFAPKRLVRSQRKFKAVYFMLNQYRFQNESIDFFENSFEQIKLIELIRQISTETLIVI